KIRVSTVHRAQGSEAKVVVFDPVTGSDKFLLTAEAKRLINVAISRAQGKLILPLSEGDLENPIFAQIVQRERLSADTRGVNAIEDLLGRADFPSCAVGTKVAIGKHTGEVHRVSTDRKTLFMINQATGLEQAFDLTFLREKYRKLGSENQEK
ncbi:MAG: ATP-binding domain-containing protein, partial [Macromonas sp.]